MFKQEGTMIEIRRNAGNTNPSDVETIAHFNIALCRETEGRELDPATITNGVRRFVTEPNRGRYFVAEIDGQVVGTSRAHFRMERLEERRNLVDSECIRASRFSQQGCVPHSLHAHEGTR
jgi:hypothetical protein